MAAPIPINEPDRLEALKRYRVLDSGSERAFDDIVELASFICGVPIALISLLDEERQWFKAKVGLEVAETPRSQAFCAHTILGSNSMVVEDARQDSRFASNPLVTGAPHIRFYAGTPLMTPDGQALGSLCIIDRFPRKLSGDQRNALEALGRQVSLLLEFRRTSQELATALERVKTLDPLVPICAYFFVTAPQSRRSSQEFLSQVWGHRAAWRDTFKHLFVFSTTSSKWQVAARAGSIVTVTGGVLISTLTVISSLAFTSKRT